MPGLLSCPVETYLPLLLKLWRDRSAVRPLRRDMPARGTAFTESELWEAGHAVRELSRGFTRDRRLAGRSYMDDPRLLGGYLLYFWPVSYAQTWAAATLAGLLRPSTNRRVLDIGSGPGPSSLALADMGMSSVTAADRSDASLALARDIARDAGKRLQTRTADLTKESDVERLSGSGPFDLLVAVHTLNELWVADPDRIQRRVTLMVRLARLLAPGGRVLLVEPALTTTANDSILVRDSLVRDGWTVVSPCTFAGDCPALPSGTCHAEVAWDPPRAVTRLAHAARIGKEALAFSYFLLAPKGTERAADDVEAQRPTSHPVGHYRVVSERFLAKSGRVRLLVCGPEGRFPVSVDGRSELPAARTLRGLGRYDLVSVERAEKRETGYGLTGESSLRVVRRALGRSQREP